MTGRMTLVRPGAGQNAILSVGPAARLEFAFDRHDAVLSKDGQSLVFTFYDGGKLILEGFYDNFGGNAQPPTITVQGNEMESWIFAVLAKRGYNPRPHRAHPCPAVSLWPK